MKRLVLGVVLAAAVAAGFKTSGGAEQTWERIPFPGPALRVSGLAWFEEDSPALRRLPARLEKTFRPEVWSLAQHTSGGRIRFRTDSRRIAVTAKAGDATVMHHFTSVGQNGLDLYVDGRYMGSAWPDGTGRIDVEWPASSDGQMHDVAVYLPLYKNISIAEFRIDHGSRLTDPSPFAVAKPVVYYGSSITQGGCATNAGLSYQAIVSRWLNLDFVNLGMSGQGLGEKEMAKAVAEIDSSCVVLDYWGNPSLQVYRDTMPVFVDTIREKRPEVPILVVGPFYLPYERLSGPGSVTDPDHKRRFARSFVDTRRKAGDANIHFVDGLEMISSHQSEGLVDGIHPNSLGFYFCAQGLRPHLERVLRLD